MEQRERTLLAGLPDTGLPGWNTLWQNAVGGAMGRSECIEARVDRGVAAAIRMVLTR